MHKQPIPIEKYRQEKHGSDCTETSGTGLQALMHKQPILTNCTSKRFKVATALKPQAQYIRHSGTNNQYQLKKYSNKKQLLH